MTKRILAAIVAMVMLLSLAACTAGQTQGEATTQPAATADATATTAGDATAAPDEPTIFEKVMAGDLATLTLFPTQTGTQSGVLDTPVGDYMAEAYNIALDIWSFSSEKYTTILASGDLPDIMYLSSTVDVDNAILAKLIVELEQYFGDMPNINSNEKLATAFQYVREYRSADTGKVWALPTGVGYTAYNVNSVSRHRAVVDYTYYSELYADGNIPEVADIWDVLDVMEALVTAYPTAADGTKTYGTALSYGGSTTYETTMQSYYYLMGYTVDNLPFFIETYAACWNDGADEIYSSIFDSDSGYKEGVKWFNAMSQRGLLDPDSINYNRQDATERVKNHYSMVGLPYLNVSTNDHQTLYIGNQKSCYSINTPYGSASTFVAVGANTAQLDASLVFVDCLANPVICLTFRNGPDGEMWVVDDEGNYTPTEEYLAASTGGTDYLWKNGKHAGEAQELVLGVSFVIGSGENLPGTSLQCAADKWPAIQNGSLNPNQQKWSDFYGYQNIQEMLLDTDQLTFASGLEGITNFCVEASDEQQLMIAAIQSTIIDSTWKMIYAPNDEEFERLWNEMVDTSMQLGAQEIIDWRLAELENATAIAASFAG